MFIVIVRRALTILAKRSTLNVSKVEQALESATQLVSRPPALLASLEQLADHVREANHPDREKFHAIYVQCRPLANTATLADVV